MRMRPPRSTRTDTLFPYTTLFRSATSRPRTPCRNCPPSRQCHSTAPPAGPDERRRDGNRRRASARPMRAHTATSLFRVPRTPRYSGRSEERRVGKECAVRVDLGGGRIIKKKNKKIAQDYKERTKVQ